MKLNSKFKNKDLELLFDGFPLPPKSDFKNIERSILVRLRNLAHARSWKDLFLISGNCPEKLKGIELFSIRVNIQYRLTFLWEDNQAWEIDINKHDKSYGK